MINKFTHFFLMGSITDRLTILIGDLKRESHRLETDLIRLANLSNEICKETAKIEKETEGD